MAVTAWADGVRVEVATLDGAPVYHWRTFKSTVPDDVERALIMREFERKNFKIPLKLVDDAVQREITGNFGGDADRVTRQLRQIGASLEDFRRFTREEIVVGAMLYQNGGNSAGKARKQADWLERLRSGAHVKRLSAKHETVASFTS